MASTYPAWPSPAAHRDPPRAVRLRRRSTSRTETARPAVEPNGVRGRRGPRRRSWAHRATASCERTCGFPFADRSSGLAVAIQEQCRGRKRPLFPKKSPPSRQGAAGRSKTGDVQFPSGPDSVRDPATGPTGQTRLESPYRVLLQSARGCDPREAVPFRSLGRESGPPLKTRRRFQRTNTCRARSVREELPVFFFAEHRRLRAQRIGRIDPT